LTAHTPGGDVVTSALTRGLGRWAERDDLSARLLGATLAGLVIAATAIAAGDNYLFISQRLAVGYAIVIPLVALAPGARFIWAQTIAAVAIYVAARVDGETTWLEGLALLGQQALFFAVLWRAPIHRIGLRRALILGTTLAVVPVYYWMNGRGTDIIPFLGSWRHFLLAVVVTAASKRTALATVRNLALPFMMSNPIPLEMAGVADRRAVTMLGGGVIFAIGLVSCALYVPRIHLAPLEWSDGIPLLLGSSILSYLIMVWRVAAFGCLLMGHCYMLGIRVPAPITFPLKWTNLAELWRGAGVYLYRFAFDCYYLSFFPKADRSAIGTTLKITGLSLAVGYGHFVFGGPQFTWTAVAIWILIGVTTGATVAYLRHRSQQRMRAYRRDGRVPVRSRWSLALVPVSVAAVLAFRGLIEDGQVHYGFGSRLAAVLGWKR
jgi:hypothetical protein